jgi:hypothetical protein
LFLPSIFSSYLLRQRSKAEAALDSKVEQPKIWRPSEENPDGEIVTIPKPPPPIGQLSFI